SRLSTTAAVAACAAAPASGARSSSLRLLRSCRPLRCRCRALCRCLALSRLRCPALRSGRCCTGCAATTAWRRCAALSRKNGAARRSGAEVGAVGGLELELLLVRAARFLGTLTALLRFFDVAHVDARREVVARDSGACGFEVVVGAG